MIAMCWVVPGALVAQDVPELLRVHGDLHHEILVSVKAAEWTSGGVAVLTDPEPAVHLFEQDGYARWGRRGGGPAELASPIDLAGHGSSLIVLDAGHRKLVTFREDGGFVEMRGLGDWANRIFLMDGDTILGQFAPMDPARSVVRLAGEARDTIIAYSTSDRVIRLEAPGAPSLTLAEPFTAQPQWTVLPERLLAFWTPSTGHIRLIDFDGGERARLQPVGPTYPVSHEDQEVWLASAIPEDFMGQRVFEPLRSQARDVVTFPRSFPAVMELQGDPSGGIWIRKSAEGSGQVWYFLRRDGEEAGSIRLPPGRRLLKVGTKEFAVLSEDDLGVERMEIYRRPIWAGQ